MDFLLGGVAAMCAGLFSNPFDVIKTRQQLAGELQPDMKKGQVKLPYRSLIASFRNIFRAEGINGIQKGLVPALAFQFIMNSTRLGTYQTVDNLNWTSFGTNTHHSMPLCIFWGGVAGVIGSSLGCPFYMIKTQIQSESAGRLAVGYQHHHRGVVDAITKILRENGFKGLWRGYTGIVPRTAVASSAQLSTFSSTKDLLLNYEVFKNSVFLTACGASMVSGFFTVVFMTPFDVIATRLFNQGVDKDGKGLLYKNIFDCFRRTIKYEGFFGLYKGFVPNYWRTAPHTIINLTIWDQFKKWKDIYFAEEVNVYFE